MDIPDSSSPPFEEAHDASAQHLARLEVVNRRIFEKLESYTAYNFTTQQSVALNIFFDLAQEFTCVEDVYAVCVMIPHALFDLNCTLYVLDGHNDILSCCSTLCPVQAGTMQFATQTAVTGDRLQVPIKGNRELISLLPFTPRGDIIGMLELTPAAGLTEHDILFWGRYANRIGFQLHNRFISQKNKEHVEFIRGMVKDIGHNVIVPNMYFKLFYKRLEARINLLRQVQESFRSIQGECAGECSIDDERWTQLDSDISYAFSAIQEQYKEIFSHYQSTSLFLETLLRSSHFEEGRYVLEKRKCNFKHQVIDPQVERYRARLADRGIEIDTSMGGVPDQEIEVVGDVGLLSQVYANLFSNVVKYAREVLEGGRRRKFMSYGWQILDDFFGPGRRGVKLNVFSSGPPIDQAQRAGLFSEGYRASNSSGEYGTGHGLYFVQEVVKLHGGVVGYEATPAGNNFYFVLPLDPPEPDDETP
uniref:histidine kinase n=1 Tax=Fundidesulfovibrio putealis TaxID=270496 RepID=A0A7C4AAE5_9BACT